MRVDHHQPRERGLPFADSEDTLIARHHADGVSMNVTAARLDRSVKSIQERVYRLRKSGVIPGYQPKRSSALIADGRPLTIAPPITLRDDEKLVAQTLAHGGFPRAVPTHVGTIWVGPDNMPWRYGRSI